ncbi:hypothetical protein BDU57DRAFT_261761 [Ampelomyces quisqualis]|uniref:Uncharacterized protein n=1 Tax=Ampelomyces quisqualis TaxID=50730 RepID=A0A6A5QI51_AMPQU|nr:hypothetical protein BDU57DRAFT_261761 [Ampelomyces quisqualis]
MFRRGEQIRSSIPAGPSPAQSLDSSSEHATLHMASDNISPADRPRGCAILDQSVCRPVAPAPTRRENNSRDESVPLFPTTKPLRSTSHTPSSTAHETAPHAGTPDRWGISP